MDPLQPPATVSVVVPARNEEATIAAVVTRCFAAMDTMGRGGEVLVVNDGSTDGTAHALAQLQCTYPHLRIHTNRRSGGMTNALERMFAASAGDIVILIPADMESDPLVDIPALVNHMEATDLDVVAGWRQGRKDGKVFASNIYNFVMTKIGGVDVHDGNWIKAMRRDVIDSFPPLRSDWHRFLLMIAAHNGFRIGEVPTFYQPRPAGSSKFGWERIPKSFLDVLVLKFLLAFSDAPMRFFGGLGLAGLIVSGVIFAYLILLYLVAQTQQRPIFIAAGILAVISVLLILVGFL
ncbi:MAG: glycosyltransferase, partial [Caldilineaceae bacterium]|nr:glycosyltransferase [Caldilineaceae bacterium]